MKIEGTNLEGKQISLAEFDLIMEDTGFIRWAWDYDRATYDYRLYDESSGDNFYVRVPTEAIEGIIEDHGDALLKIGSPYIGRHTYPFGVHYDEEFPDHVLKVAKQRLNEASTQVNANPDS